MLAYKVWTNVILLTNSLSSLLNCCLTKEAAALPVLKEEPWFLFFFSMANQLSSAPMPSPEVSPQMHKGAPRFSYFTLIRLSTLKNKLLSVWWSKSKDSLSASCWLLSGSVHVNVSNKVSNNSVAVASSICDPSSIFGFARRWLIGEESVGCTRLISRACTTPWTHL